MIFKSPRRGIVAGEFVGVLFDLLDQLRLLFQFPRVLGRHHVRFAHVRPGVPMPRFVRGFALRVILRNVSHTKCFLNHPA